MTGRDLTLLGQLRIHPMTSLTGYALGPRRSHRDWPVDYFGSPRNTHQRASMDQLPWSSTQGRMAPTLWRVQCFRSPRLGPCPSWRLTTNDHTKNSAMICSLENPTAPFAEEPCRATSEYLEGGPTAGPRWFPKPGAPVPVRDRSPANTWGFPELTHQDQVDTDNDSLLLLRFLVILTLAHEGAKAHGASPPASFLEHPEDPAQCSNSPSAHRSSIWAIEWLRNLLQALGLNLIHFDQCRLGQCAPKPTTLATNLDLRHWEQLRCNHPSHTKPMGTTSSDLSRYPWNMMQGLARAILESDASQGSKPPTPPANKTDRPTTQTHPRWHWMTIQCGSS